MGPLLQGIGKERSLFRLIFLFFWKKEKRKKDTHHLFPPFLFSLRYPSPFPFFFPLQRIKDAGGVLTTSESLLFELLRDAKHPKFKECATLLKAESPESGLSPLI